MNKQQLIQHLKLEPHLEGGYFRRTFCSEHITSANDKLQRPMMSSIYYLLSDDSPIGHFHQNRSDIMHYWHQGSALRYHLISPEGELTNIVLGPNLDQGEVLQLLVPGGYWKATILESGEFGLLSEAVSPGFMYEDMQLLSQETLKNDFPRVWQQHSKQLSPLCKL